MKALFVTDRSLAESLQPFLAEEGILVEIAEHPARADFKVQTANYDAVLLDRDHLGGRVRSSLMRWRRDGLRSHVLVLLPGSCISSERVETLNAGADVCLLQPLCPDELRAHLRALRRREGVPLNPVRQIHDLEIDTVSRTVRRAGRPIHLTPREFDLLQFLTYHQGHVVSRAMIRDYLYDGHDTERSNVVDVYIRYLRNKIDKDSDNPLILTRWGQGYVFRAATA